MDVAFRAAIVLSFALVKGFTGSASWAQAFNTTHLLISVDFYDPLKYLIMLMLSPPHRQPNTNKTKLSMARHKKENHLKKPLIIASSSKHKLEQSK